VIKWKRSSPDNANAWMATYSDMVTLLLAFFVMLFSFSSVDAEKFQQLLGSVQAALGIKMDLNMGGAPVPLPPPEELDDLVIDARELVKKTDLDQLESVRSRLEESFVSRLGGRQIILAMQERGLVIRFADSVLFDSGRAVLKPGAREILELFAREATAFPNHIRVEGHTDNRPISTMRFPSNWELSTARATEVVRFLMESDELEATRLSAAGYGEYRPVATNDTREGRALNRRVDLVILRISLSEGEPR